MTTFICPTCPVKDCESYNVIKCGVVPLSHRRFRQNYQCKDCGRKFLGEFIDGNGNAVIPVGSGDPR